MSRRADQLLSWLLIMVSGLIFAGIVFVGVPRLLTPRAVAESVASVPTPMLTIATPKPLSTDPPPTDPPTSVPTEKPEPTETPVPIPTETSLPTEIPPTATPEILTGVVVALDDAILFDAAASEQQTGAVFNAGDIADAVGRSPDSLWVHIVTISDQGWVPVVQVSFEAGSLEKLPETDFVYVQPTPTPTSTSIPATAIAVNPPPTTQIQPTSPPTFPTPVPTVWPTHTPAAAFVFPTPVPTTANVAQSAPPTTPPDASQQSDEPIANAIAWWDIDPGSARSSGSGTWQVDIVLRVPTSFQYTFDMAHLWRVNLRDRNLDGDDYYVISLSGMACGSSVSAPLVVRQAGVRMKVVNEFSVQEGPVFVSPSC